MGAGRVACIKLRPNPARRVPYGIMARWAFSRIDYAADKLHFVKGLIEETVPQHAPSRIALLRLDTDWYESTRHELVHLFRLIAPGGVLIVDDYGH
jgi:O-methyltransferase